MTRSLISFLIALLFAASVCAAPVWEEVASSSLQSSGVLYDWSPSSVPGVTGYAAIMSAWSGAAFDPTRNRMMIHGGGHADYAGQEIYAFDFDDNTWYRIADPDTVAAIASANRLTCYDCTITDEVACTTASGTWDSFSSTCLIPAYDNKTACERAGLTWKCSPPDRTVNDYPRSVHTYDRLFYNSTEDALCDPRGSVGYAWCTTGSAMACWDLTNGGWDWSYTTTNIVGGTGSGSAIDPDTGDYWIGGSGYLAHYDVSTDTWNRGSSDVWMSVTYNKNAVIDDANDFFVMTQRTGNNASDKKIYAMALTDFVSGSTDLSNYEIKPTGTGPATNFQATAMAYDPVGQRIVVWDGGTTVYYLTYSGGSWAWTSDTAVGVTPPTITSNGVFGRFEYIPSEDKFAVITAIDENVHFLDIRPDSGVAETSFTLSSSGTSAITPFTAGVVFTEGAVPTGDIPTLSLADYQVEIKKTWNDGSAKHAIFSGVYDASGGDVEVTVYDDGTVPTGTNLTTSDLNTAVQALGTTTVQLGSIGTSTLSSLTSGVADRTWLQGPEMIEAHYSEDIANDLHVKWHVRYYSTGDLRIRAIVENGTINGANANETYIPTVTINGTVEYNNGGLSLTQYDHTRYSVTAWTGTDPEVKIAHDTDYLQASKLVPNYWKTGPSESALNNLASTYTPMGQAQWREDMSAAGYHPQIGLLPNWDALYLNSGGDSRAFDAVEINAEALNSYPIIWSDPSTDAPLVLDSWPTWTIYGAGGGGDYKIGAGDLVWDVAHHGSGGYLAYLITGDYYYLSTMEHQSALVYLIMSSVNGSGTSRLLEPVQTRSVAWANRTIGQLTSIAPSSASVDDFQEMLDYSMDYWASYIDTAGMNELGYFNFYYSGPWDGLEGVFMQHFVIQSYGYISDLEPLSSMTNLNYAKDHIYKAIVGILGGGGASNYCYYRAGDSYIYVTDGTSGDLTTWFDSWGDVYAENWGEANPDTCPTYMSDEGNLASNHALATGYWANLFPAISYAVEDQAPGAYDSWMRLTSATNFSDFENSGFDDTPVWGIVPRGWE